MADNKITGKNGNRSNPGPGRPKGSQNKIPGQIREMVLTALTEEGGVEYFRELAKNHPVAFCGLIGKILPTQVEGGENPVQEAMEIRWVTPTKEEVEAA